MSRKPQLKRKDRRLGTRTKSSLMVPEHAATVILLSFAGQTMASPQKKRGSQAQPRRSRVRRLGHSAIILLKVAWAMETEWSRMTSRAWNGCAPL